MGTCSGEDVFILVEDGRSIEGYKDIAARGSSLVSVGVEMRNFSSLEVGAKGKGEGEECRNEEKRGASLSHND